MEGVAAATFAFRGDGSQASKRVMHRTIFTFPVHGMGGRGWTPPGEFRLHVCRMQQKFQGVHGCNVAMGPSASQSENAASKHRTIAYSM